MKPNAPKNILGFFSGAAVLLAAALVMAATIPGRTQGLALITQRLVPDIEGLDDQHFALINLWATLIGGLFCLPCGWLLDRVRPKYLALGTMLVLGLVTVGMTTARSSWELAGWLTLTRGLGQSMLSVISITLMAKWFRRDSAVPMALYAIAMTMLMVVGFGTLQGQLSTAPVKDFGVGSWRPIWSGLGWALVILSPLAFVLAWPVTPGRKPTDEASVSFASATLWQAMGTSCFWSFSLSISLFGLVSSGVSLYQEQIFGTLGLEPKVFYTCQLIGLGVGLLSNFISGLLARYLSPALLLSVAMTVFAASLVAMPFLRTPAQAYAQAVVHSLAGGTIVVLFYLIWVQAFGPKHVGEIQGAVQWMTVVASALGPIVVIGGRDLGGGFAPILWTLSGAAALLALHAFLSPVPKASRGDWSRLAPGTEPNVELSQETV